MFLQSTRDTDETLFVTHGIFQSSKSMRSICLKVDIASQRNVVLFDLWNHGESPENDDMSYEAMAKDLIDYADEYNISKFDIMGHSMGGKLAMHTALWHPDWVRSVISIEAAPKNHSKHPDISYNTNQMMEKVWGVKLDGLTWKLAIDELLNTFHD